MKSPTCDSPISKCAARGFLIILKPYKTHTDTFREYLCNYINNQNVEKMAMLIERCLAYVLRNLYSYMYSCIMKATKNAN